MNYFTFYLYNVNYFTNTVSKPFLKIRFVTKYLVIGNGNAVGRENQTQLHDANQTTISDLLQDILAGDSTAFKSLLKKTTLYDK